jgi:hypothetical protein
MRRMVIAAAMGLVAVGATASTASASIYKVDVRGSQKLTWSFDAELQVGGCASEGGNVPVTRHWTGSGTSQFEFQSKQPGSGVVMRDMTGKLFASFSASAKATGTLDGSWVVSETHGGCPTFAPDPGYVEDTSACGPQSWTMMINAQNEKNFLYISGKQDLAKPGSPDVSDYDKCPLALSSAPVTIGRVGGSDDAGPCEQQLVDGHKISWELAGLGRGIANTKIAMKAKEAGKKRIALSRRVKKSCLIPVFSGNDTKPAIRVDVETRVTVILRRTVK